MHLPLTFCSYGISPWNPQPKLIRPSTLYNLSNVENIIKGKKFTTKLRKAREKKERGLLISIMLSGVRLVDLPLVETGPILLCPRLNLLNETVIDFHIKVGCWVDLPQCFHTSNMP